MAVIGQGISHIGLEHDEFHYPFNLAAGIGSGDIGKAVSVDATADRTVKLAADDDVVLGKLVSVEDRTVEGTLVGAVALKGGFQFTKTAPAVAVGDSVIGAGSGLVKAAVSANSTVVTAVSGNDVEVLVL